MLIAERKTEVYQRKDGGDGKGLNSASGVEKHNQPAEDTPKRSWNMIVPVLILVRRLKSGRRRLYGLCEILYFSGGHFAYPFTLLHFWHRSFLFSTC